jgi:dihydrofolate reductase
MKISFIAAIAENYVIGKDGDLPWRLPSDLRWFKQTTIHKPCVMGRRTYESLGKPLPSRQNIVVTRDTSFHAPCDVVHTIDAALTCAGEAEEIMILGGATIYEALFDRADRFYLTVVHARPAGDTLFPAFDLSQWNIMSREDVDADEKNPIPHSFFVLDRVSYAPFEGQEDSLPAPLLRPISQ